MLLGVMYERKPFEYCCRRWTESCILTMIILRRVISMLAFEGRVVWLRWQGIGKGDSVHGLPESVLPVPGIGLKLSELRFRFICLNCCLFCLLFFRLGDVHLESVCGG